MPESPPSVHDLSDTGVLLHVRAEARIDCPDRPAVPMSPRGLFISCPVRVCDVSSKGIGFFACLPLEPGTRVALLWPTGAENDHRTVTATVVHSAPRSPRVWRVGCAFEAPLSPDELGAFLRRCGVNGTAG